MEHVSGGNASNTPFLSARKLNMTDSLFAALLLLLWPAMSLLIQDSGPTAGFVDPNILLLIILSLLSFLLFAGLSWFLLQRFWAVSGLPELDVMVLQFKELRLWQQLGFYYLAFVSLLFAGIMCLMAIC